MIVLQELAFYTIFFDSVSLHLRLKEIAEVMMWGLASDIGFEVSDSWLMRFGHLIVL